MHQGLVDAAINFDIDKYADTFSPVKTKSKDPVAKIIFDVMVTLFGVMNAGVGFVAGVQKIGQHDGKLLSLGSGAANALISGSFAVGKEYLPA
jgi:hypothetical protein